jgi:hypothetical protein
MSPELIGILAVGAALATLNLTTLRGDIHALDDRIRGLDDRMRTQERSTAKLEGLLEGLREAVVVRAGPWSGSEEVQG